MAAIVLKVRGSNIQKLEIVSIYKLIRYCLFSTMKCFRVNYCLLTKTNSMRFFFKTTWCSLLNTRTTHNEPCRCKAKTNSDSFVRSPLEFDNRGRVISSNVCVYCEIAIALLDLTAAGPACIKYLHWMSCCISHDLRYLLPTQSLQV